MTQNIYDSPAFFAAYSQLERSIHGLSGAVEWPTIRAMIATCRGLRVLDLGCGFGWFCRWARDDGAATVVGVDISRNMLAKARAMESDEHEHKADASITYQEADLESLILPEREYDLVYSSLTLHYLVGLPALVTQVYGALRPGGRFIFSVEHPIHTAPSSAELQQLAWRERDGESEGKRRTFWPLDGYFDEGPRVTDWLAPGVVKQHYMTETYIRLLLKAGFVLVALKEWGPSEEQVARKPEWAAERARPLFLLVEARRPEDLAQ